MPARRASLGVDSDEIVPHRIRHLTAIHIANFTPFPARDEFTSALNRPSEQPQYAEHGHLSDDFDVTLGRKRGRRRSNASISTAQESPRAALESRFVAEVPRRRAVSRASIPGSKTRSSGGGPPPTRPSQRHRTISASSTNSQSTILDLPIDTSVSSVSSSHGVLRDTSQPALEKILSSRLVETFITISVPPDACPKSSADGHTGTRVLRRNTVSTASNERPPRISVPPRRTPPASSATSSKTGTGHVKSVSVSSPTLNGQHSIKPSSQRSPRPFPSSRGSVASTSRPSTPDRVVTTSERPAPDYLSPIHRPSVNPSFTLDARNGSDFAPGTNLSGCKMFVEIWANEPSNTTGHIAKGKGKERADIYDSTGEHQPGFEWKVLKAWEVNLNELVPFPDNATTDAFRMPSNTLCIVLDPPGKMYYLPSTPTTQVEGSRSRSISPPAGYNSDPESNTRRVKPPSSSPASATPRNGAQGGAQSDITELTDEARYSKRKGRLKSAGWQDLLKLVTVQAVIRDTEHSLSEVIRGVESHVGHNALNASIREVSERRAWVDELQTHRETVLLQSDDLRNRLSTKSEELKERREMLRRARETHAEDLRKDEACAIEIGVERERLDMLRSRLPSIRGSLFTSLAFIYPIELISPPDLLFTILDVPLPIPTGPTDPAPPLFLASHKDITEDSVATALGYAAQVVQLLAAYLGQGLIYPVTCVGSRSLIKDGISMMVGPRMFPLFSKGVDTYRFEYGVFLLNKDIELLMTDRNLRALDVRHTLPNLKNLLLTLTDPDAVEMRPHRPLSVASTTISALQSPVLGPSTLQEPSSALADPLDTLTIREHPLTDADSPPPSGSTTPTKSRAETPTPTNTVRKPRGFLDISGFFRARQPSISRSSGKAESSSMAEHHESTDTAVSVANGHVSHALDESNATGDDEDDRRTIRATGSEDVAEIKSTTSTHANGCVNGNGTVIDHSHPQNAAEKAGRDLHASQVVDSVS